ncbi:hypothetical protein Q9L58_010717, partial [Maublancomyces gigas]
MVSGKEIVRRLGFKSVTSPEWKAFIAQFRKEFLEPREEICRGYHYFLNTGNRIAWDQCIQQMFGQYPEIWAQTRFPGEGGVKERSQYGQAFLVSQTKKIRAARNLQEKQRTEPKNRKTKRKRANEAESTDHRPQIRRMGSEKSFLPTEMDSSEQRTMEFPGLLCLIRYEGVESIVPHDSVRRFNEVVEWILKEFDIPKVRNILIRVSTIIQDPGLREIMGPGLYMINTNAHDQASWNTAILNAHLNRDLSQGCLKFVVVAVETEAVEDEGTDTEMIADEGTDIEMI